MLIFLAISICCTTFLRCLGKIAPNSPFLSSIITSVTASLVCRLATIAIWWMIAYLIFEILL